MNQEVKKILEDKFDYDFDSEIFTDEVLTIIDETIQATTLQLLQTDVSGSSLKPSDLIEFAKWINNKGYSHRLKLLPNELIGFYLQNRDNIIKVNAENCH